MSYTPPQEILQKYADVIVNFALGGGKGIKPGETVYLAGSEVTKPFFKELSKAVVKAGGNVLERIEIDDPGYRLEKLNLMKGGQLDWFPNKAVKGDIDEMDHMIRIFGDRDPHELEGADLTKVSRLIEASKNFRVWRDEKELDGRFSWCVMLYGTEGQAAEAGMSLEEYWGQIIDACFLDHDDPIAQWRKVDAQLKQYIAKLNQLNIEKVHVEGEEADLWITIGENRGWNDGGGRNIPSFEIFTCPDWRGTNGWIRVNQPLYRHGNLVKGIRLEFKDGVVTSATAEENQALLEGILKVKNADKVGEFSLTDAGLSRISRFMATTLYDENMGGKYGNTHIALGAALPDVYSGDRNNLTKEKLSKLGFNDSAEHCDIISTADRTVTGTLRDGSEKVIYEKGKFNL